MNVRRSRWTVTWETFLSTNGCAHENGFHHCAACLGFKWFLILTLRLIQCDNDINMCVSFIEYHLLLELINQLKRKGGGEIFKAPPPLNECLCFDLFQPLRTSRRLSGPPLFLVKGSFIWEKSPISDQRFALMQIFINLRGRCGLYCSLPFWWELNLILHCGLCGSQQWPVLLPVSAHNQRDPIKSFGAIKGDKSTRRHKVRAPLFASSPFFCIMLINLPWKQQEKTHVLWA